ncbi:MAG: GNAT family N-acetyltransferase [Bdellovibrionales bacterium]
MTDANRARPPTGGFSATLHDAISEIGVLEWNRCAGADNPFLEYDFLDALEKSGSANPESGWSPCHATIKNRRDETVAVIPLYLKAHSYGEYVFDGGWADAFQRAGGRYYPKLQVAVPFSPVPGPRFLIRPGYAITAKSCGGILSDIAKSMGVSSVHVTFCTEVEYSGLIEAGWMPRLGTQFHWHNPGYKNFDDFLAALSSRKRKMIRHERKAAKESGLKFLTLSGAEIREAHWDAFYRFYLSTVERKWGHAYLARPFFSMLSERMGDRIVLMMAEHGSQLVAGALNLAGGDTLYGRNWGCEGKWPFLHFELCYYQAIDFAISRGLKSVEAGAQGDHKIQRGYLPIPTYSCHWVAHKGLAKAIDNYLENERLTVKQDMEALASLSPFRKKP